ncbi:hypothetical protein XELAEV_18014060mg [Xenopus laevis]|uniref:Uncharacterized protein n=1 Tax=Xenopus laevis TaxID=8355 RepID=A0A974DQZ3_XENLA|nr:hypothetical protein XELAEV_18014060mg [Xenopus laevis]
MGRRTGPRTGRRPGLRTGRRPGPRMGRRPETGLEQGLGAVTEVEQGYSMEQKQDLEQPGARARKQEVRGVPQISSYGNKRNVKGRVHLDFQPYPTNKANWNRTEREVSVVKKRRQQPGGPRFYCLSSLTNSAPPYNSLEQ